MEFSNLYFLYIWLPLVLAGYFLARDMRWKNYILAGFSLFFYAMGQPIYLGLLVGLTYVNFRLAHEIRPGEASTLWKPVVVNIGALALFKYLDFLLSLVGLRTGDGVLLTVVKWLIGGLNRIGFGFDVPDSLLPMGISFYTFSMISYLADVYRGRVEPEASFRKLVLYAAMFPKILQGPIVRYSEIQPQLSRREVRPQAVFEGGLRFLVGLGKKVLLADYCARVISEMTAVGSHTTFVGAWFSAVLFMFQIYFDFSGYSDMAIGLGRVFGFDFCENFRLPYMARSITDFWRRWHISLGTFFRDYVYIPLGGNRQGWRRQVRNLLAVWALTGLWHGASWNYVLWGLYFFGLLTAEKYFAARLETIPAPGRHAMTLLLVLLGWVLFAHEDFGELGRAVLGMLGFGGFACSGVGLKLLNSLPLLAACAVGCTGLPRLAAERWRTLCGVTGENDDQITPMKLAYAASAFALMAALLWLCTVSLIGNSSAPSIYGNF